MSEHGADRFRSGRDSDRSARGPGRSTRSPVVRHHSGPNARHRAALPGLGFERGPPRAVSVSGARVRVATGCFGCRRGRDPARGSPEAVPVRRPVGRRPHGGEMRPRRPRIRSRARCRLRSGATDDRSVGGAGIGKAPIARLRRRVERLRDGRGEPLRRPRRSPARLAIDRTTSRCRAGRGVRIGEPPIVPVGSEWRRGWSRPWFLARPRMASGRVGDPARPADAPRPARGAGGGGRTASEAAGRSPACGSRPGLDAKRRGSRGEPARPGRPRRPSHGSGHRSRVVPAPGRGLRRTFGHQRDVAGVLSTSNTRSRRGPCAPSSIEGGMSPVREGPVIRLTERGGQPGRPRSRVQASS